MKALQQRTRGVVALARSGVLPWRPDELIRMGLIARRFGATLATGCSVNAMRFPDDVALVDEDGALTWRELDERSNAVAHGLQQAGATEGGTIGILGRNHRGFVELLIAAAKLGAHVVLLNTGFGAPQLKEVVENEDVDLVVHDEEFADRFHETDVTLLTESEIERLATTCDTASLDPPSRPGRTIILTSGTTGTPKGAQRDAPKNPMSEVSAALARIPLRAREPVVIAPPLFHGLGYGFVGFSLLMAAPMVLRRKFDPEGFLADLANNHATTTVVVPVMLKRVLDLPDDVRARHDLGSLRVVVCSGAPLRHELADRFMDEYGDVIYNFYGSTEVAWAAVATPADLRAAPGTVGYPPPGTTLRLLDDDGNDVPRGELGRIYVGNDLTFEGYTGGGNKDVVDGLLATGDVGHFDEAGRLFVEGRDDDMIVSGGENVFPKEVEQVLAERADVDDVAVVGVDDDEMGQRLKAVIVPAAEPYPDEAEIKSYVKQRLARHKVPRDVEFVDELPRNPTGKVLRRELQTADGEQEESGRPA